MPNEIDRARLAQKYPTAGKRSLEIPLGHRARQRTPSMISTG
jgi:hypothetical protein